MVVVYCVSFSSLVCCFSFLFLFVVVAVVVVVVVVVAVVVTAVVVVAIILSTASSSSSLDKQQPKGSLQLGTKWQKTKRDCAPGKTRGKPICSNL